MKNYRFLLLALALLLFKTASADSNPQFSTAGFYELPQSGRTVHSMNPAWRFYKGSAEGAESVTFDDSRWEVVSLPHGLEYLPTEASGCINYQGEAFFAGGAFFMPCGRLQNAFFIRRILVKEPRLCYYTVVLLKTQRKLFFSGFSQGSR